MATRPAVPNVIKHELVWLRDLGLGVHEPQWYMTTIHVEHTAPATQAHADADYAVIRAWATASWRPLAVNVVLVEIKGYGLDVVPPVRFTRDVVFPATVIRGTRADSAGPWQVCPVLSMRTGAVGQKPKPPSGSLFHVGSTINMLANGIDVSGSVLSTLPAAYEALRTGFTGVGDVGTLVLVSHWLGGTRAVPVLRAAPLVLPITHVRISPIMGTLRSRRPRQQSYTFN